MRYMSLQFFKKHDRQLLCFYAIIQTESTNRNRKGDCSNEDGTAYWHSVHPASAGEGHFSGVAEQMGNLIETPDGVWFLKYERARKQDSRSE